MSRLKLKVNNCLLNNKEFFKLFNGIFNKIGYNCFIIFQDYLNIKILKYDENFEILWNFWILKFYIFFLIFKFWTLFFFGKFDPLPMEYQPLPMVYRPPYPWYFDPLFMVYWPPYPWYIDPLTHGIVTPLSMVYRPPLPMVYRPPYPWYFDLTAYLLIRNGGGSIFNKGVQYTMDVNRPRVQFTMEFKIPYDTGLYKVYFKKTIFKNLKHLNCLCN